MRSTKAGELFSVSVYRTKNVKLVEILPDAGDAPSFVRVGWSFVITTATKSRLRAQRVVSCEAVSTKRTRTVPAERYGAGRDTL